MDAGTVNALIGAGGAIAGAIIGATLQSVLPSDLFQWLGRVPPENSIVGSWDSWWGPTLEQVKTYHEVVTIRKQYKNRLWGTASRSDEPDRVWELVGRFDGHYLQMFYYPSKESSDLNFLDYGCYFFIRQGDGSMKGFSAGYGPDEATGSDTLTTEHCYMKKRAH